MTPHAHFIEANAATLIDNGLAIKRPLRYRFHGNNDCDSSQRGESMDSDDLREQLLAAELAHLKNEIVTQLSRWARCRDDRDLLMALRTVEELVAIEDDWA